MRTYSVSLKGHVYCSASSNEQDKITNPIIFEFVHLFACLTSSLSLSCTVLLKFFTALHLDTSDQDQNTDKKKANTRRGSGLCVCTAMNKKYYTLKIRSSKDH